MNKISKNMKITQRIMIPIAILFIALILVGTLSIVQIVSLSKLSDEVSVVSDILRMRNDHLSWVMKLRDSIDTNEEFTGGPDPTQCRMGKWMYLDETQSHPDPDVQSYLAEIEPYHNLLHEAVPIVNALVADQETEQLRQYYYDTIDPTLGSIMTILTKLDVKFSEIGTAAHDKLKSTEQSSIVLLAVAVSVGLVISAIMAVYVIVNLNKILNNLTAELSSSSKSVSSASV
ncbi:MAG: CZB domain-containing protein, partial [Clostridiales bacterium]|nr:CZB domain-containing protein [Clostridiales bacterium]